jgi:tRNA threonylcarbamoyladenosine biosynthesis protein TsaB
VAYLLHIESTSTVCSVAVSENNTLIAIKEINDGFTHAENLHLFIQSVLQQVGLTLNQLHGISISSGPGSYTGLRIGFASAKGLAYALSIPLIKVDTLQSLSRSVIESVNKDAYYCPLIDARRMEVYYAAHNIELIEIQRPANLILTENTISIFDLDKDIYFFGDGLEKSKSILGQLKRANFVENIVPSSKYLISLAFDKYTKNEFEDLAYTEPFYLKDFYFTTPSNK